jgi:hypothetical protein
VVDKDETESRTLGKQEAKPSQSNRTMADAF